MSIDNADIEPWGAARYRKRRRTWHPTEVRRLKVMVHGGAPDEDIAKRLDRTVRSVAVKRSRLGLTIRTLARRSIGDYSDSSLTRELRGRGYTVSKVGES